eukprot:gene17253-biopygen26156
MGKRVDFSARTVITPDPNLSIDELGVPKRIAMNLSFPEVVNQYNIEELRLLVEKGADQYPGAKHVRKADGVGGSGGRTIRLKDHPLLREVVANLDIGDVVERHLRNGDYVLFNRQPSLHKMSMMAHRVRVMSHNTFRLNVCVCACYNADFDGDEMNMHIPQSLQTHHELQALAAVPLHMLSPRYSKPIISIVQDVALGVYRITQTNIQVTERQLFNLVAPNPTADARTLPQTEMMMVSGRELLSTVLPPTLNAYLINENKDVGDDNFQGRLVHSVFNTEGPDAVTLMLNNTQKLICDWLVLSGFSVGISDLWIPEETRIAIRAELDSAKKNVRELLKNVHEGTFENASTRTNAEYLEESITMALKRGEETAGKLALSGTDPEKNSILNMIANGSKGKQGRTLPHFTKYDDGPEARGFVEHSFIEGLTPHEFFFHSMAGRIGLIDTAVRSVTWETPIVIIEDGQAKCVRIGEWVDAHLLAREAVEHVQHFPEERDLELLELQTTVHIPTLDADGVVTWGAMTAITRHDPGERLYKVITHGGREVTVAESKSLLVWNADEEKFQEKDLPDVKVGDLLPVTMRLAEPPPCALVRTTHVDVSEFLSKTEYVYGTDFNIATRMFAKEQGATVRIPREWWWRLYNGKEFTLPYDKQAKFQRATSVLGRSGTPDDIIIKDGCVYPFHAASRCQDHGHIPARFELDFEFGVFVGLYLADGHTTRVKSGGVVSIGKKDNDKGRDFVEEWFSSKLGLKTRLASKETNDDMGTTTTTSSLFGYYYSSPLARFLDQFVGRGARNKHVPDIAYIAPVDFVRGLLSGYISGNGTIIDRSAISTSLVSRRLTEGILMLCNRLGVFGKISSSTIAVQKAPNIVKKKAKEDNSTTAPMHTLYVRAQWARKLAESGLELIHAKKQLRLKAMKAVEKESLHAAADYKEQNDVVLDPIKSISIIGVGEHPKLYDVTVPSTLNFIVANGLGLHDTSDTGYLQRKLIKAMEDCKVHHDRTVRNVNGHVVQFLYGEDGMNATSLEFHSLPYMALVSPADMRPEYLIATEEEALELGAGAPPHDPVTIQRLVNHFKQLVDDRRFVIETLCHSRSEDVPITYPVNFARIVEDSAALHGAKSDADAVDEVVGPDAILDTIDDLVSAMVVMQEERQKDLLHRRWPPILLRAFLSPKVLMRRFRMTRTALSRVASEILHEFRKAVATPGEMVGIVAAQSIGEPCTQLTLNSFHVAGQQAAAAATSGVPRLCELLSLTKKIKTPAMTLQLRPEHSASIERAKEVMSDIQTTLLKDVVRSSAIYFDPHDDERSVVLADHGLLAFRKKYRLQIAQDGCSSSSGGQRSSPWLMRVVLDSEKMLECNVRMLDVEVALGNMYGENVSCILADDNARELVCRVRLTTSSSGDEDLLTVVKALHQSMMESCVIKGVVGISKAVLAMPAQGLKRFDPLTDAFVKNDTWSILTAGSNLVEVLSNDMIDGRRARTNDVFEIMTVLGIEAARTALIEEIRNVLGDLPLNHRHLALLGDTMSNRGFSMSVDRHGINNRGELGPLAKCSFEQSEKMLINAGIFSEFDRMNGVSANTIVGQIVPCGTGDTQVFLDDEMLRASNVLSNVHMAQGHPPITINSDNNNYNNNNSNSNSNTTAHRGAAAAPLLTVNTMVIHTAADNASSGAGADERMQTASTAMMMLEQDTSFASRSKFADLDGVSQCTLVSLHDDFKYMTMSTAQSMYMQALINGQDMLIAAVIVSPARELAEQTLAQARCLFARCPKSLSVPTLVGGVRSTSGDRSALNGAALGGERTVAVVTPGRLIEHMQSTPGFSEGLARHGRVLVLDEVDRLLDPGFRPVVMKVAAAMTNPARQTLLFTATASKDVQELARSLLKGDDTFLNAGGASEAQGSAGAAHNTNVKQEAVLVRADQMVPVIREEFRSENHGLTVIFVPTAAMASTLASVLRSYKDAGTSVFEIHSRLSQGQQSRAVSDFKKAKPPAAIVATNVFARGLDVSGVTLVLQLGIAPDNAQVAHCVGRTGRGGATGRALMVLAMSEERVLRDLIDREKMPIVLRPPYTDKQLLPPPPIPSSTTAPCKTIIASIGFYKAQMKRTDTRSRFLFVCVDGRQASSIPSCVDSVPLIITRDAAVVRGEKDILDFVESGKGDTVESDLMTASDLSREYESMSFLDDGAHNTMMSTSSCRIPYEQYIKSRDDKFFLEISPNMVEETGQVINMDFMDMKFDFKIVDIIRSRWQTLTQADRSAVWEQPKFASYSM